MGINLSKLEKLMTVLKDLKNTKKLGDDDKPNERIDKEKDNESEENKEEIEEEIEEEVET